MLNSVEFFLYQTSFSFTYNQLALHFKDSFCFRGNIYWQIIEQLSWTVIRGTNFWFRLSFKNFKNFRFIFLIELFFFFVIPFLPPRARLNIDSLKKFLIIVIFSSSAPCAHITNTYMSHYIDSFWLSCVNHFVFLFLRVVFVFSFDFCFLFCTRDTIYTYIFISYWIFWTSWWNSAATRIELSSEDSLTNWLGSGKVTIGIRSLLAITNMSFSILAANWDFGLDSILVEIGIAMVVNFGGGGLGGFETFLL